MKTPISYYGGKQSIIHHILPLIPQHEIYTETFFGGGTVFWAKNPVKNETINDRLDVCINFYQVLKFQFKALKRLIEASLISRTMQETATRIVKGKIPADNVTKAWAFWYACNFSFACKIGGGIKYSNDSNTLPTVTLLNKKAEFIDELCSRLEQTQIECTDALTILKSRNVCKAFHYLDTPYLNTDMGHYKGYTEANLIDLLSWCTNECKGKFLLSNYNSDVLQNFIDQNGWNKIEVVHKLKAPRKSGNDKVEVLVFNYEIEKPLTLF